MFVIISVIYRPIEQLLSRTIADRRARGRDGPSAARADADPGGLRAAVPGRRAGAAASRSIDDLFDGIDALYWILVVGMLAYAASYFARGWLAGHERFALYGGLVLMESTSRFLFALAVAIGIALRADGGRARHRGGAVRVAGGRPVRARRACATGRPSAGRAEAVPTPPARGPRTPRSRRPSTTCRCATARGSRSRCVGIMLAEQTLMNAAVLIVDATPGAALAGFVFNVLLIVRAPLQLFQAIQTSILPHLAGLEATREPRGVPQAIRMTVLAIAAFAGAVALGLLAIGPSVMTALLGNKGFTYGRVGLALVGVGMGLHLIAGHAQPGRARAQPRRRWRPRPGCWRRRCSCVRGARRRSAPR